MKFNCPHCSERITAKGQKQATALKEAVTCPYCSSRFDGNPFIETRAINLMWAASIIVLLQGMLAWSSNELILVTINLAALLVIAAGIFITLRKFNTQVGKLRKLNNTTNPDA